MKQYIIDAFTSRPFSGNPAAVCVMDRWPSEEFMKLLARENNLSETAFIVKEDKYHLRWFTPQTEVNLCGHATLASSYVIFNYIEPEAQEIVFTTCSGDLTIRRKGKYIEMSFPSYELKEIPVTDDMEKAFGIRPEKAFLGMDLVCVFADEEQVRNMEPDMNIVRKLEGRLQNVTARGSEADIVSRSFVPGMGISEDPVCGSAHCSIIPYWTEVLGKNEILAYQASERGGYLHCTLQDDGRLLIAGEAVPVAVSELLVEY